MTRKMPREAFATEIAPNAGWTVIDNFPGLANTPGVEFDVYLGLGTDTVVIGWNLASHCASYVAVGDKRITGALGLIEARRYMEDHAVAAV